MLSPMEMGVVLLVAIMLFGPGRIAGVGKGLGQGIRNFKQGLAGLDEEEPEVAAKDVAKKGAAKAKKGAAEEGVAKKAEELQGSPEASTPPADEAAAAPSASSSAIA